MKIVAAEWWRRDIPLREPYTIAYETYDRTTNFFLRLELADGTSGYGCAAPAPEVTGETCDACAEALGRFCSSVPGPAPGEHPAFSATPAASAAVEMALLDAEARRAGVAAYALLGGRRAALPTSITLGISDLETTLRDAQHHVDEGFRRLKVKGGRDPELDAARLVALRQRFGDDLVLCFDANQGYDVAAAGAFLAAAAAARADVLEQPTSAQAPEQLGAIRLLLDGMTGPAPALLADEAALGLHDAEMLLADEALDGVVIKLMKCGGISAAAGIAALPAARPGRHMLSCMDESALAIAAALHLALVTPGIEWIDLDGHLDLVEDPAAGAVQLRDGCLLPLAQPGFGVEPAP
jgi:L-alanine-DL-glutamate epimerase-like enolase superfamily enzyme